MTKKIMMAVALFLACVATVRAQSAADVVVPRPNNVELLGGDVQVSKSIKIKHKNAAGVAKYAREEIVAQFGVAEKETKPTLVQINVNKNAKMGAEAYELLIKDDKIKIVAATKAGAFYGVQTLLQLLRASQQEDGFKLTAQKIVDSPRFEWRSYMLDESRHFMGEVGVYRLLDAMADMKMNVFHWHLTDDAGWRIEIKKYPLLTEIGGKRKDTQVGGWNSDETTGEPYEGFYTQRQIRRILKYAKERNIKVVPEIEMPGHACAAIAAYPWLGTKNEQIDVPAKFGKHYHTYDVIDPRVKQFLKDVVKEVYELFDTDVIHIGGDEVRFDHWEEDADMVAHKEKMGYTSFMDIQIEFTNEMSRYIESLGASMMGWNEILGTNLHADDNISFDETSTKIAPNVIVHFWKGDLNELTKAAQDGYRLVNSYHGSTYLDYSHDNISLSKAYSFDPIPEGLSKEYEDNVIGLGTQMWREWAPTEERVQTQTFPRLAAYAEVGWSDLANKDYDNFVLRLRELVKYWSESCGLSYHEYEELK